MSKEKFAHYDFGELKAGDKFVWKGIEYEKVSGSFASRIVDGKAEEIPDEAKVYLFELW